MLVLISPSKSIMVRPAPAGLKTTSPAFEETADMVAAKLAKYSLKRLQSTLGVSTKLAELNQKRFKAWQETPKRPALWMYSGDVYNGMDAFSIDSVGVKYAQDNLIIISGLYGLLRPLDGVRPYRLEMSTSLAVGKHKNLYSLWQKRIAEHLQRTGQDVVLMCASPEYAKAILLGQDYKVITPRFMQPTASGLKEKGIFAKYARGALARWVIDNQAKTPEQLKSYDKDGFKFSAKHSSPSEYVFIVPKNFTLKGRFVKQ